MFGTHYTDLFFFFFILISWPVPRKASARQMQLALTQLETHCFLLYKKGERRWLRQLVWICTESKQVMNCFLCSLWALNRGIILSPANSECMRLNTEEKNAFFERHFICPCRPSFLCPFLPLFIYSVNDKYLSSSSHEAGPVLSSGSTGVNK